MLGTQKEKRDLHRKIASSTLSVKSPSGVKWVTLELKGKTQASVRDLEIIIQSLHHNESAEEPRVKTVRISEV